MKPIISITSNYSYDKNEFKIREYYINAILKVGGIPIIISPNLGNEIDKILEISQGLILSGGGDINPLLLNEEPTSCGNICPIRDKFELDICRHAVNNNKSVLGICRGIQIIAAAFGGSIYQDIKETSLKHFQQAPSFCPTHSINIEKNSIIMNIFKKDKIYVNSFHHQAVKSVDNCFKISAKSNDGIIEGIEHKYKNFVVGVQWHPECMLKDESQILLFDKFIKSIKDY